MIRRLDLASVEQQDQRSHSDLWNASLKDFWDRGDGPTSKDFLKNGAQNFGDSCFKLLQDISVY